MAELHQELEEQLKGNEILNPEYRRKKLRMYGIRTLLSAGLYWFFWEVSWVPFTLWFYVPLNLFGLGMIWLMPEILKRKIQKAHTKIDEAQVLMTEEADSSFAEDDTAD